LHDAGMHETMVLPSDIEACHRLLREQGVVITKCRTAITEREAVIPNGAQ